MNIYLEVIFILLASLVVVDTILGFIVMKSEGRATVRNTLGYILGSLLGFVLGIFILSPVVLITKRIDMFRKHKKSLITKGIYDKFANLVSEDSCLYFSYDRTLMHCVGFSLIII